MLADCLPDRFGHALIDTWLLTQGRSPESFNPIERLCYTGSRGMGALEFFPTIGPDKHHSAQLDLDKLVDLASEVLGQRQSLKATLSEPEALQDILQVGTSAGGARAKAVIAWNPDTQEIRSGQVDVEQGFSHWMLKFDGVSNNKDKELADPRGFGLIEYAYYVMAQNAGIQMSESRLLHENNRSHFMTRRFDRTINGSKLHMQTLAAIAHFDFNQAGAYSYEQAFHVLKQLQLPMESIEEQFRRMAFNLVARNQDDHVKNIAFLMDQSGQWSLSPAYDVTYSHNPLGSWTHQHQMSLNNKCDRFELSDFVICAKTIGLKRGRAQRILKQVIDAVTLWPDIAENTGIPGQHIQQIKQSHRLNLLT